MMPIAVASGFIAGDVPVHLLPAVSVGVMVMIHG